MNSIDIFPWNDNFNTGIPLIDEQHRKLADLINLLASHVAFNANIPALNVIFDELAAYAVYHFDAEEKIWHEHMPEDLLETDHRKVHSSFLTEVLRLKSEENTKPTSKVIEEVLAFLTRWLAAHILESDRSMAMVVMAMQSGMSLDAAKKQAAEQMRGATRVLIDIILSIYESLSTNTLHLMRELAEQKRMALQLDDQERHFEILLSTTPVGIFETDTNGKCNYVNARWSEIAGLSFEAAMGDGWTKALHPDDKDKIYAEWTASTAENRPFHLEYRFLHPEGKIVWVLGQSANYKSRLNDQSGYVGTITDITERKQAEVNLQRESEKNQALLCNASDGIHILDYDGNVVEASDSFCTMLGYSREEIIGMNVTQWDAGFANIEMLLSAVRQQFKSLVRSQFETRYRCKNGNIFDVEISSNPLELDGEKLQFNSSRNISKRKKIEKALQDSETHLRTIIKNEPECIKTVDAQGHLVEMSPAGLAMIEADSLEQVVGLLVEDLIAPEYRDAFTEMHKRVIAGESLQMEFEVIGLKGGRRWLETHAVPIQENDETLHLAVTRDITARKLAEENIESASLYARSLIEASLDPLVTISADGKITDVNTATEQVTGIDRKKLIGSDFADYFTEPDKAHAGYQQAFAQGSVTDYPLAIRHVSGSITDVLYNANVYRDAKGNVSGVFAAARDVTERKKMEEEVHQLAFYDSLTKLPNRRLLIDRLGQNILASKRNCTYGALMFLDLDNFKPLNDKHGHEAGDMLLIEAAKRLTGCMREMDTVARFGGDEFVVILGDLGVDKAVSITQATIAAEKIRTALSEPYIFNISHTELPNIKVEHRCTASIGVVVFNGIEGSQEDIMKWADTAMYVAKDSGRNQIIFYGK